MGEFTNFINGFTAASETANIVWIRAFDTLFDMGEKHQPSLESRDGEVVSEILNATLCVDDPTRNLVTAPVRKLSTRYAIGEFVWYMSGNPSLGAIRNITTAWDRMSDDGKTVNSNYGYCIREKFGFNQWEYVKELLKKDPTSRQAVIHIKEPRDTLNQPTKDLNCTTTLQFLLRNNKLFMTVNMRSNDVWMGLPYDIFSFTCLQMMMAMELECELGSYTHHANSLHLYKRDFETAKERMKSFSSGAV